MLSNSIYFKKDFLVCSVPQNFTISQIKHVTLLPELVKMSDFAAGRPDVSYIIELSTCYTKTCYFKQIMHIFSILNKWVGYFDPSFYDLKYSVA